MNAQDSPIQGWITGWTGFLQGTLPLVFLVVVIAVGLLIMIRKGNKKGVAGGVKAAIVFGVGAALVFLILTNVEAFADLFGGELPLPERD